MKHLVGEPHVAVAETHTGAVLFVGDLAYKVKKPVALGFLDWTDRADREQAIDTELALNRRLAPDVYLGTSVLPGPDGENEPVLLMRRLPANRRLSTLVQGGADVDDILRRLTHQLAAFHLATSVTVAATAAASPQQTRRRWEVNHDRLKPSFGRWIDGDLAEMLFERACRYLKGRAALLDERIAQGRARDGHGDLLADDVFCLDDGPRILDCLDFDDELRVGDVLADVAFLAMDLERLGRADLGWRVLELHRAMTADNWPASLAHHYVAYRAQVRTLVMCVRADQGDLAAGAQAADHLSLADHHLDAGRVRLIVVGGSPGSGKSTLAKALGDALGAPVLHSDETRKELAGLSADEDASAAVREGIYTEEWTDRTYARLLHRAEWLLGHGEPVVLDATWAEDRRRAAARDLAARTWSELIELRCVVDDETARQRAAARAERGGELSDAGPVVASAIAARFRPWPEAVEISTASTIGASLDEALGLVNAGKAVSAADDHSTQTF